MLAVILQVGHFLASLLRLQGYLHALLAIFFFFAGSAGWGGVEFSSVDLNRQAPLVLKHTPLKKKKGYLSACFQKTPGLPIPGLSSGMHVPAVANGASNSTLSWWHFPPLYKGTL